MKPLRTNGTLNTTEVQEWSSASLFPSTDMFLLYSICKMYHTELKINESWIAYLRQKINRK